MSWDRKSLLARIAEHGGRKRFAAGSPNSDEIAAYHDGLLQCGAKDSALVLGMTPELRVLVAGLFDRTYAADNNPDSLSIYGDWLPEEQRKKEGVILEDWLNLDGCFDEPLSAIVGDGIFGNLIGLDLHSRFLQVIRGLLSGRGVFVTRKILVPRGFDPQTENFTTKLEAYRKGDVDSDEFGFFSRMLGFYRECYCPESYVLENRPVFDSVENLRCSGVLSEDEFSAINRYYFSGKNCVLPEEVWEGLLRENGFAFRVIPCSGKEWYRYYKVYCCWPRTP